MQEDRARDKLSARSIYGGPSEPCKKSYERRGYEALLKKKRSRYSGNTTKGEANGGVVT